MMKLDWRDWELAEGILREPGLDASRLVLWLPGPTEGQDRLWERVGNAPGAEVRVEEGLCATAATSIQARQRARGLLGRVFGLFQKSKEEQVWLLPNGESAEQVGPRQTDLLLVWAEDEAIPLTEERLRGRWPEASRVAQLGRSLFLVAQGPTASGPSEPGPAPVPLPEAPPQMNLPPVQPAAPPAPEPPSPAATPPLPPLEGGPGGDTPPLERPPPVQREPAPPNPGERAQQMLAAARQAGDRPREMLALTDLALAWRRIGEPARAVAILQEALSLARQLGDRRAEGDVLGNLGVAVFHAGQPAQALDFLKRQLAFAREAGDHFEAKMALENLGLVYAALRDHPRGAAAYQQALALAREVNDRRHEAELLWLLAIQSAERGHQEPACASAEAALALFEQLGSPHLGLLRGCLQQYRSGDFAGVPAAGKAHPGPSSGEAEEPATAPASSGPSLLRSAFSALRALSNALALGAGVATVPAAAQQSRLEVCGTCEHHTGLRCRLCGTFTSVKAALPHEQCPISKWPASASGDKVTG
jgi:tetratricopeptide (TPR) repeat protein